MRLFLIGTLGCFLAVIVITACIKTTKEVSSLDEFGDNIGLETIPIYRKGSAAFYTKKALQLQTIEKKKVDDFIKKLSALKCRSFVEGKTKKDFTNPIFSAGLSGTNNYSLTIYAKKDDKADKYPAVSSGSDFPFFLSKYTAEDIMKKLTPEKKAENKAGK